MEKSGSELEFDWFKFRFPSRQFPAVHFICLDEFGGGSISEQTWNFIIGQEEFVRNRFLQVKVLFGLALVALLTLSFNMGNSAVLASQPEPALASPNAPLSPLPTLIRTVTARPPTSSPTATLISGTLNCDTIAPGVTCTNYGTYLDYNINIAVSGLTGGATANEIFIGTYKQTTNPGYMGMSSQFIHCETSPFTFNTVSSAVNIQPWGGTPVTYPSFTSSAGTDVCVRNDIAEDWRYVQAFSGNTNWLFVHGDVNAILTGYSIVGHIYLYSNQNFMTVTPTRTPTPTTTSTPATTSTMTNTPDSCLGGDFEIQGVTGSNGQIPFYGVRGSSYFWDPIVSFEGDYVNSIWIIKDYRNKLEIGWYKRGEAYGGAHSYFRTWTINGIYREEAWGTPSINTGYQFQLFNLNGNQQWEYYANGTKMRPDITTDFSYGTAGAMRERHNKCDAGWAHWWNLQRCDYGCNWSLWQTIDERNINETDWFLNIISPSEFSVSTQ